MGYKHRKARSVLQGVSLCVRHSSPWSKASAFQSRGPGFCPGNAASPPGRHLPGRPAVNSPQFCTETWGCRRGGLCPVPTRPLATHAPAPLLSFLPSLSSLATCKCHHNVCVPIAPSLTGAPGVGTRAIFFFFSVNMALDKRLYTDFNFHKFLYLERNCLC